MKYVILVAILLAFVYCQSERKGGETLPSFNLLLVDSVTQFNTQWINKGKPVILLYFSPDCEHCQNETEGILQNMDSLKEVTFYFITNDPFQRLQVYNQVYKLFNYSNIVMGRDYKFFFPGHFKGAAPPYLVIYDQYKRERAVFNGETKASQIISFINNL